MATGGELVALAALLYRAGVALINTTVGAGGGEFPETRAALVEELARGELSPETWKHLCQCYWGPIYSYLRIFCRESNQEAKDLTQSFLVWLLESGVTQRYQQEQASFRNFLKGVLYNYVRSQRRSKSRRKKHEICWDEIQPNSDEFDHWAAFADEGQESPEDAFDRGWVQALVRRSLDRTRETFARRGHEDRYESYDAYELHSGVQPTYAQVAESRGIKESDVRNHLSEVRKVLRREIRTELLETVSDPAQLDLEWEVVLQWGH